MVYKGMKEIICLSIRSNILFSLEANNYLLSCPLNDDKLYLYQTASKESNE
jgi:hypothetical protein